MSNSIPADMLADAVQTILASFREDTIEMTENCAVAGGNEAVDFLKANSPKKTGAYAKSWTLKKARKAGKAIKVTVYNKDHYQLTHLLEHGHAKIDGGRSRAYPHISLAEEAASASIDEKIKFEVGKNK